VADKRNSDFSVGYGKPPVHSRFPKGKSGNPKGRPWAYKNMSALLNEVLSQCITVSEGGKRKRMPKRKAMLTQLVNKALSGEVRSIQLVTEQLRHAETHAQQETGKGGVTLEMVRQLLDATDQEDGQG
jgi:Family of unknown function (DUF5681)